ncbi:MAG TPA: phosphohistidine phosphatase SixA [Terriglobia bacterium]|nr:phosphohistidine phosphatase SixA [Terriglobia bacterium]
MHLYLVQHGAAKSEAEDPHRCLTDEGRRDVERMARSLAPLRLGLDRIEHSEKLRARQTAEILVAHLQAAEGTHGISGLAPNDDVEPVWVRLQQATKNLMLVGHLPHLSRLTSRLLGLDSDRAVVRFQMAGVVRLDRDEVGHWEVRWVFPPELVPR